MKRLLCRLVFGGITQNAVTVDLGLAVLRVCAGLALVLVFGKLLPHQGGWGPTPEFVNEVAGMGFPAPRAFAWAAVLSESVGGGLLVVGLFTRPAALANAVTTGFAAFWFHKDIARDGATAMAFFVMTVTLLLTGPGRFSVDALFRWFRPAAAGSRAPM
jgi:putative oxidoreductase